MKAFCRAESGLSVELSVFFTLTLILFPFSKVTPQKKPCLDNKIDVFKADHWRSIGITTSAKAATDCGNAEVKVEFDKETEALTFLVFFGGLRALAFTLVY